MFEEVREQITRNILEIKIWIENIAPNGGNPDFKATSYGLFFVYVYGVYEAIVKRVISITIDELNHTGIGIGSCAYELYPVLLSNEYDSLYQVGNDKKWERRWNISRKLSLNQAISIPSEVFPTDGKNIRVRQLESIRNSFGIDKDILPRPEVGGYIQQMVDHRNHISHGDVLPKEIGRRYTKSEILNHCGIVDEVCNHLCDIFEEYIVEGKYIRRA